jgi:hypothetical protein
VYATSYEDVVRMCREEKIDYLIFDTSIHEKFESRGKGGLFEPERSFIWKTYFKPNRGKFVLANPPRESIAKRFGGAVIIDIDRLEEAVKAGRVPAPVEEKPVEDKPVEEKLDDKPPEEKPNVAPHDDAAEPDEPDVE